MSAGIAKGNRQVANCIVCGCDDDHACQPNGCSWSWVCYKQAVGVCTECQGVLDEAIAAMRQAPCTKRLILKARQMRKRWGN